MGLKIRVYYPFHPFCGCELEAVFKPKRFDGAMTIIAPDGKSLKIPSWMVLPQSSQFKILENAEISTRALLSLSNFIESLTGT